MVPKLAVSSEAEDDRGSCELSGNSGEKIIFAFGGE